jgi:CMP-N,N'-diacetyllegionaminic acid synthase
MKNLCVISARGGSKGLPNKNIKRVLGKPLICWTIEQALAVPEIDKVVVCTDSKSIKKVAVSAGAIVPFLRPKRLATSKTAKFEVWKYALAKYEKYFDTQFDSYIDLDCTNPLRSVSDISKCIRKFYRLRVKKVDAVFTICDARKNPYFNLLELSKNGSLKISKSSRRRRIIRRQDAPKVFEHVASIYVLNPDFVRRGKNLLDGYSTGYNIGQHKSLDIDSEFDLKLIEYLLKSKKRVSL